MYMVTTPITLQHDRGRAVVQQVQQRGQNGRRGGHQARVGRVLEHPHGQLHAAGLEPQRCARAVHARQHRLRPARGVEGRPERSRPCNSVHITCVLTCPAKLIECQYVIITQCHDECTFYWHRHAAASAAGSFENNREVKDVTWSTSTTGLYGLTQTRNHVACRQAKLPRLDLPSFTSYPTCSSFFPCGPARAGAAGAPAGRPGTRWRRPGCA